MEEAPNTVSGLIRKRKEIAGQIEDAQLRLRQAIIDLDNIDAVIRMFRPDIDLEESAQARCRHATAPTRER